MDKKIRPPAKVAQVMGGTPKEGSGNAEAPPHESCLGDPRPAGKPGFAVIHAAPEGSLRSPQGHSGVRC